MVDNKHAGLKCDACNAAPDKLLMLAADGRIGGDMYMLFCKTHAKSLRTKLIRFLNKEKKNDGKL